MTTVTVVPAIRNNGTSKCPVVIRVFIARKVAKTINTGIKIHPDSWDASARLVTRKEANHALYNARIKKQVAELEANVLQKSLQGVQMTKQRVKKIAEGGDPGRDFYAFCQDWIPRKYSNKETNRTYLSEVSKLQQFRREVSFGDIDYAWLTDYRNYMMNLGNSPNTIWKSFKFLNTMLADAIRMGGIIDHHPMDNFDRGKYKNPEKLGLEIADCDRLLQVVEDPHTPQTIREVGARFLLMCFSGLRFADAMTFHPDRHIIDGNRLVIRTQKKNVLLNMKLHSRLQQVIELIRLHPGAPITNQAFNRWLKVLGQLAETSTTLTAHVGRHTFGALLAETDTPLEVAQRLLAHQDSRSTKVYFHIRDKSMDKAVDKLNDL
jgi:integrase